MSDDLKLLTDLWARQPGKYICLSTKDVDDGRWVDHFLAQGALDLAEFARENAHRHCYFAPMKFDVRRRRKEHAVLPKLLWADLDAVDPNKLGELEPTIAIRSSPGRFAGLWRCDRPVSEQLNKRMTYATGADKGGWDLVQVLRLPGTRNHKYPGAPLARVIWDDGARFKVRWLEQRLPMVATLTAHKGERRASCLSMQRIIDKHELDGELKRELLGEGRFNGIDGQRGYKVHWKLACMLHEAGVPRAEAAVCLIATAWNKHSTDEPVFNMMDKIWTGGVS